MNLNMPKEVTKAARPSLMTRGTQEMLASAEVKGDATEASASDSEIPAWAAFRAPQSLAPSPHITVTQSTRYCCVVYELSIPAYNSFMIQPHFTLHATRKNFTR